MRLIAIAIAAAMVAASSGPVLAASWEEYRYEADDLAMLKEWPGEPVREMIEYSTPVIGTASAEQLVYQEDNIIYRMTVVMLPHLVEVGASIFGECVAMAEAEGTPLANMTARVEPGARAVYGRLDYRYRPAPLHRGGKRRGWQSAAVELPTVDNGNRSCRHQDSVK